VDKVANDVVMQTLQDHAPAVAAEAVDLALRSKNERIRQLGVQDILDRLGYSASKTDTKVGVAISIGEDAAKAFGDALRETNDRRIP